MDKKQAEILLYQIMSGYRTACIAGKVYLVGSPTIPQKRQAAEIYQEAFDKTAYDMWMTDAQMKSLLVSMEYVSPEVDEHFKVIGERIDELKVEMFQCAFNEEKRSKTRDLLNMVRDKQNDMFQKRHMFDAMTRQGYAEIIKTQALVALTLTDDEGTPLYESNQIHKANFSLLDKIIAEINETAIPEESMRFIARMDLWRSYWVIGKAVGNPFGIPAAKLTDDQRTLCQITRMYDSAYEHPDCPEEEVMSDDDCFDGWMISERRKNEKDKNQKMADNVTRGRHENAQEVFIVAGSDKDAKKINDLNDISSQIVKKQREAALKQKGTVHDAEMPDQQMRMRTEITQKMSQNIKNNKG